MLATGGLLGLLYVLFAVVLFNVLNVGLAPMLVIVIGLAFFQYYTSDKLALAAAGAKVVSAEDAPALHEMVERLCAMADLPKPKIAVMDTPVPNAFATGRSPKHAAVCVTTGLWERLDPKESEGVLAHELSHIANRDVLVMTDASFIIPAKVRSATAEIFMDHPPLEKRLAALAEIARQMGRATP